MQTLSRVALAVAMLTLVSTNLSAQTTLDRPTIWLVAVGDVLALGELTASEACIQQGTCHESNPIMPSGTNPGDTAARALIKGGGQAATTWIILKLSKKHPKWARVAGLGKIAFNGYLMGRALDLQGAGKYPK